MQQQAHERQKVGTPHAIYWATWCLLFTISWEGTVTVPGVGPVTRAVGLAAAGVGAVTLLWRGSFRRPCVFHLAVAAYQGWGLLSLLWSSDPDASLQRALTNIQLLVMLLLIWHAGTSRAARFGLVNAYVLGCLFPIGGTVSAFLTVTSAYGNRRFTASGLNPNDMALAVSLSIPLAVLLAVLSRRGPVRWAWWLYCALAYFAILLSASRGALVASIPGAFLLVWAASRVRAGDRAFAGISALCGCLLISLLPSGVVHRVSSVWTEVPSGSWNGRRLVWNSGMQILLAHPFAGIGYGAFRQMVGTVAHNVFLSVATEGGVVAVSLFLLVLIPLLAGLRHMDALRRRVWSTVLLTWAIGAFVSPWDDRKVAWMAFGLLSAEASGSDRTTPDCAEEAQNGVCHQRRR